MSINICPICGVKTELLLMAPCAPGWPQHRCNTKTLRGIDATMSVEDREERDRTYHQRLSEGFAMLEEDERV